MIRFTKIALAVLLCAVLCIASATVARADAVQLTTPAQLNSGDTTAVYPSDMVVPSPFSLSAGGNTLTFTKIGQGPFVSLVGGIFGNSFPAGTRYLYTANAFPQLCPPSGCFGNIDITFAAGVGEFGFLAQNNFNTFASPFSFTVFNNSTLLRTFSVSSGATASFLGARATDGDVITRILVTAGPPDFAISPVIFGSAAPTATPEPATLLLLVTGLAGVAAKARRRRYATKSEEM